MLRKCLVGLFSLLVSISVLADIDLSVSINDVYYRGTNELTGSITFKVTGDDFKNVSTAEPAYIRLRLTENAILANTLVNESASGSTSSLDDYLYLALRLEKTNAGITINSGMAEAVRIARWVAGEDEIWIQIRKSTNTWLTNGTNDLAPEPEWPVSFTIGVSARQTDDSNDSSAAVGSQLASLPFNTKDPAAVEGDFDDAWSTLICVDFCNMDDNFDCTGTLGVTELFEFDPIAYDHTAEVATGEYTEGAIFNVNFSDDRVIARGRDRQCYVSPQKNAPTASNLCVAMAGQGQNVQGWINLSNSITYTIWCDTGNNLMDTRLYNGAFFRFDTESGSNYGFSDDLSAGRPVAFSGSSTGALYLSRGWESDYNANGELSSNGVDLYRRATLEFTGDTTGRGLDLEGGQVLTVSAEVWQWYTDEATDVVLTWNLWLTDNGGEPGIGLHDEDVDYPEDWQIVDCPPSYVYVDGDDWYLGDFTDCTGTPVSIFFPFVPRVTDETGASTGFWAGLSLVNQGAHNWADGELQLYCYNENGDQFVAGLPALAVRQQANWVFANVDGVSGLWGQGGPAGEGTIIPAPSSSDVPAESFGMYKMSMFVYGSFVAEYSDFINLGDIDGYLLIGSGFAADGGAEINGAYLPRNMTWRHPLQDGIDMPILQNKQ